MGKDYDAILERMNKQSDNDYTAVRILEKIGDEVITTGKGINAFLSELDAWDAAHPVKTYAQDFFEKFPDAEKHPFTGCPAICIRKIYPEGKAKTPSAFICMHDITDCSVCWNRPMEESK
jgi:hypothetical protein